MHAYNFAMFSHADHNQKKIRSLPACAALLHDLGPVEARQLAESVIAVNYRPLHDLGVSQEEAGL